jgi:predicted nucleic acid-binding protein
VTFVLDASITMAWFFIDEATPYTASVRDSLQTTNAWVSPVWPLEVANTLLLGERRQRVTPAQVANALELLMDLPITVDDISLATVWGAVLAIGRAENLTAYDASYLELAARRGLPLATIDARLRTAALRMGVHLVPEPEIQPELES